MTAKCVHAPIEPTAALLADRALLSDVGGRGHLALLDSVAQFTHHRDIDALDHSLTLSLAQLSAAQVVSLYKRAGENGDALRTLVRCVRDADGALSVRSLELDTHDTLHQAPSSGVHRRLPCGAYQLRVPILRDGVLLGELQLEGHDPLAPLQPLVEGMARIYANYMALIHESEHDKLTGLYNRGALDRHLQRLLKQFRGAALLSGDKPPLDRAGEIWLAILDIDHFKRINDTLGHLYGDEVILLLAQQMRTSFRQGDVLFRFGGEEFVVLLGASDADAAHHALDRFRRSVADHVFPQIGCVTVSIGYARVSANDYPATVLDRADKALYFAKNNGRNRLYNYECLRQLGELSASHAGSVDLF